MTLFSTDIIHGRGYLEKLFGCWRITAQFFNCSGTGCLLILRETVSIYLNGSLIITRLLKVCRTIIYRVVYNNERRQPSLLIFSSDQILYLKMMMLKHFHSFILRLFLLIPSTDPLFACRSWVLSKTFLIFRGREFF